MGNDNSNSVSNNSINSHQSEMQSLVNSAFSFTKSHQITRSQFNQALKIFEAVNYISLCNSHLAARLFEIMEPDKYGKLEKNMAAQKLKKFIRDPSKSNKYSFKVYDADNDGKISRRQFSDYLQKSWATQIQIVKQRLKTQTNFDAPAFYQWLKQKKGDILQISGQIFSYIDQQNKNYISFQQFQKWINSGQYDLIVFKFGDTSLKFPLHIGAIINTSN